MNKALELLTESNGQLSAARMIAYIFAIVVAMKLVKNIFAGGEPLTWEDIALVGMSQGWKTIQKKFENGG